MTIKSKFFLTKDFQYENIENPCIKIYQKEKRNNEGDGKQNIFNNWV